MRLPPLPFSLDNAMCMLSDPTSPDLNLTSCNLSEMLRPITQLFALLDRKTRAPIPRHFLLCLCPFHFAILLETWSSLVDTGALDRNYVSKESGNDLTNKAESFHKDAWIAQEE